MRFYILFFLNFIFSSVSAQKKVTFQLTNLGADETYYFASNINGWNPADAKFQFDNNYGLTFSAPANTLVEYKITRGSWDKAECQRNGLPASNRELRINSSDTIVYLEVAAWSDKVKKSPMKSDRLIPDTLYSVALKKEKAIWVYLPIGYSDENIRYPVVYLQDGQNLFDGYYTHNGQEWCVDEISDSLSKAVGGKKYIMVGVGSDSDRLSEYSPYPWKEPREINGGKYLDFLVREMIPYVEQKFRANKIRAIAGSSMGALISLEGILKYPDVFQSAGLFSMAQAKVLPDNEFVLNHVKKAIKDNRKRNVFIYYGEKETETLPVFSKQLFQTFKVQDTIRAVIKENKIGRHEEKYWGHPFVCFLDFLDK